MRSTNLHTIALVDGNGGHHASDLDLDARAVDQLAGGDQVLKQDAQQLAGVQSQRVHLDLHLQQDSLDVIVSPDDTLPATSSPLLACCMLQL